jgi:ribonuclease E
MKRMLVNATQHEELRVAMVDGQKLYDLDIEVPSREQRKANIYKGRITRIEPSLEAAFVDYGAERHGFLPLKEISSEYFVNEPAPDARVNIRDVLREGQEIVVQVEKEERGNKGAALTTYVSLAGRFLVLMPNNPGAGGVSRRITGEDRDVVRDSLDELNPPEHMGCIVRTAGVGREIEELRWDLDYLLRVWEAIKSVVVTRPAPFLIYQEGNAIVRALRDNFSNEIGELLIDDPAVYKDAEEFMSRVMPQSLRKLKLYEETSVPLFTRFQIESQIESAYAHTVSLPSGGSIVIDHTEALTAIDINSARATKGDDIEQTALNTNLEAAEEIARQLRIRDLGGLIVIDFIDMGPQRNQRDVENRLRESVRHDRARIQIGKISRFGLLEMSRQRLRPSLEESTQLVCPRCSGNGVVRSVESLALAVLRLVGEEARKDRTAKVIAVVPIEVANFILNEKRDWVQNIQHSNEVGVVIVGDPELETPNYSIRRVRDDETQNAENTGVSYSFVQTREDPAAKYENTKPAPKPDQPAVTEVLPATPAPVIEESEKPRREPAPKPSLWKRLFGWLGGSETRPPEKDRSARRRQSQPRRGSQSQHESSDRRSHGQSQGQNRKQRSRSGRPGRNSGQGSAQTGASSGGSSGASGGGDAGASGSGSRSRRSRNRRGRGSGGSSHRQGSPTPPNAGDGPTAKSTEDSGNTSSRPAHDSSPKATGEARAPSATQQQPQGGGPQPSSGFAVSAASSASAPPSPPPAASASASPPASLPAVASAPPPATGRPPAPPPPVASTSPPSESSPSAPKFQRTEPSSVENRSGSDSAS